MTTILAGILGCALIGAQDFSPAAPDWRPVQELRAASLSGATLEIAPDGTVRVTGRAAETDAYTLEVVLNAPKITGLRLEALPDDALKEKGPGRSQNGNFVLTAFRLAAGPKLGGAGRRQVIQNASASHAQKNWPVWGTIDEDPKTGWGILPEAGQASSAYFELGNPIEYKNGAKLTITLDFQFGQHHTLGRFRLYWTDSPPPFVTRAPAAFDKELQPKINAAIDHGIDFLLDQQELDGSWAANQDRYRNGQTALSVYTLIKSGLAPEHPAIRRALAFLAAKDPGETYSNGCQLMALEAVGDPAHLPWARRLTDLMLSWQHSNGGWAYPWGGVDLSNTQYAALGLRAAARIGVPIEPSVWSSLADRVIEHQEETSNPYAPAGFGYHPKREPTGSMSAAGVSVMAICQEQLTEGHPNNGRIRNSIERGVAWLTRYFSAQDNPKGPNDEWATYYLYGIERVAALMDLDRLGTHDWYRSGAQNLTGKQSDKGSWSATAGRDQENTAFALLFLSRATAPTTGKSIMRSAKIYQQDDATSDIALRASGDTPLTVWISSMGKKPAEKAVAGGGSEVDPGVSANEAPPLEVRRVEYVSPKTEPIGGAAIWQYTTKEPKGDWMATGFVDARWETGTGPFGPSSGAGVSIRSEWTEAALWLRRELLIDPADLVSPELELYWSNRPPTGPRNLAGPPLVELFDEEVDFVSLLTEKGGSSQAVARFEGAQLGEVYLEVGPQQRHNPNIPGWFFPIAQKPGEGEYRFLRFAWKKPGDDGVMIQLAFDGNWSKPIRYLAGKNTLDWEAIEVGKRSPSDWMVVTRDLYKDLGGRAASLTGIALTPMSGDAACFDGIYLGRSLKDLKAAERRKREPKERARRGSAEPAITSLTIYLNGEPLYEDAFPTIGYEPLVLPIGWQERLRHGRNVIAVGCQRADALQTFDLRLVDRRRLAVIDVPADRAVDQRFPAQIRFTRPGDHVVVARAHVAAGPESKGTVVLESPPLTVSIEEAEDPLLLEYASDPERNLLANQQARVKASSELNGWPAAHAVDNLQRRGWLCVDGDPAPSLTVLLERPVKANAILLSPTRAERADADRTASMERVEIQINGKGDPFIIEIPESRLHKALLELDRPQAIRRLDIRVLSTRPGKKPNKTAVGFAEVELQLRK